MAQNSGITRKGNLFIEVIIKPSIDTVAESAGNLGATDNPIDYDMQLEREQEEAFYNEANGQVKERLTSEINGGNVGNYSSQIIKPMKKFQLLERAMRDYPAGTVARFKSAPDTDHTSDGIFKILDINHDGSTNVYSGSGLNCFYVSRDDEWAILIPKKGTIPVGSKVKITKTESGCQGAEGQIGTILPNDIVADHGWCENDKWDYKVNISGEHWRVKGEFELLPASILSGKCAIQVNNEREFKLLMEHYESKGWKNFSDLSAAYCLKNMWPAPSYATSYENKWSSSDKSFFENKGYSIIPFSDFAKEVGIKVPVFVLTSEDGVDLYEGDDCYVPQVQPKGKYGRAAEMTVMKIYKESSTAKFFHSKAAAEAWIKEQNKPREVTVQLFNEYQSAKITKDWVALRVGDEDGHTTTMIKPSDLEDMLHAYKSL